MKHLTLVKSFRDTYNKKFFELPELIRKKYPQYTSDAQEAEKIKAKESIFIEHREKVSNIKSIIKSDKTKAQKEFYGLKYPDRISNISVYRETGVKQKTNALLFLNFSTDAGILGEIKQAFDINDIDYASCLLDGVRAKFDLYSREELNRLTTDEASANLDKVNRSNKYLTNPEAFPLLNAVSKIEREHFGNKLNDLQTEIKDIETASSVVTDFENQISVGVEYLRSPELMPYLTEPERLEMFNQPFSNKQEEKEVISFRRRAAEIWKQSK